MADNDAKIQLSAKAFATAMAKRVVRERGRIATFLDEQADGLEGLPPVDVPFLLRGWAELIRQGGYGGGNGTIVPTDQQAESVDDSPVDEAYEGDGFAPHRDRDDFEDGEALVRARRAAQALSQRHGGILAD